MAAFAVLVPLLLCQVSWAARVGDPKELVRNFLAAFEAKEYRKAYDFLSTQVKEEVSYELFEKRARDIRRVRILSLNVFERSGTLVKMRIKARIHLRYQGSLYEALYLGTADLAMEKGCWKVAEVVLKPLEQKKLNEGGKPIKFGRQ